MGWSALVMLDVITQRWYTVRRADLREHTDIVFLSNIFNLTSESLKTVG